MEKAGQARPLEFLHFPRKIVSVFEASLEAQLRAVRRLHQGEPAAGPRQRKSLSQVDMAFDTLKKARTLCIYRRFSNVSRRTSASPSIAKAWSLLSPRGSPAATVFYARKRTPSPCGRRCDEPAFRVSRNREMKKWYRTALKQQNLSQRFVAIGEQLRQELYQAGGGKESCC